MIYLTPIGFDTSHVLSGLVKKGILDEDRVVLVAPDKNLEDERFKSAKKEIETFLGKVGNASLEVLTVNHSNFQEATLKIKEFIEKQDEKVVLNASQSAREVLLASVMACMYSRSCVKETILFSDVDRKLLDAELPFVTDISDSSRKYLETIKEETTVGEIAEKLDVDRSTASRNINKLEEKNLVTTRKEGRTKKIQLTFTGKLLHT